MRGEASHASVLRLKARWSRTGRSLWFVRFAFTFVVRRMKILCVICQDLLIPSEDVSFTRCGHVFHHRCLSHWLERSKTCPQCRDKATEDRIHRAHFTLSNTETTTDNTDNLSLQGRLDSLTFQILLNEKNIKHYTSKNAILEKQNAGLRQEVRKVESELNQKNSAIYALKEQIKYFKEQYREYEVLKKKLSRRERDVELLQEIMSKKTRKIENLQDQLIVHRDSVTEERSKNIEFEIRLALCESENLSLRHRVIELESLLEITSDQNHVTKFSSRRNSNENSNVLYTDPIHVQAVDICSKQINTKQETADQNGPSSPKREAEMVTDANQENSVHNSTFDECPIIKKKARLCSRTGNSSDKTNDVTMSDIRNTTGNSSQSKQKKMLKLKSLS